MLLLLGSEAVGLIRVQPEVARRSRGAIRLGLGMACIQTPTRNQISSLLTLDPRFEGVRIQWVRLHDRAIRRRFSPGSGKLDFVCMTLGGGPKPRICSTLHFNFGGPKVLKL